MKSRVKLFEFSYSVSKNMGCVVNHEVAVRPRSKALLRIGKNKITFSINGTRITVPEYSFPGPPGTCPDQISFSNLTEKFVDVMWTIVEREYASGNISSLCHEAWLAA